MRHERRDFSGANRSSVIAPIRPKGRIGAIMLNQARFSVIPLQAGGRSAVLCGFLYVLRQQGLHVERRESRRGRADEGRPRGREVLTDDLPRPAGVRPIVKQPSG